MNPERRDKLALGLLTWLSTAVAITLAAWQWQAAEGTVARLEADRLLPVAAFAVTGAVVGWVACFSRPRSGVKQPVSPVRLLPVLLDAGVAIAVLFAWLALPD
jgi:hypothetical protein